MRISIIMEALTGKFDTDLQRTARNAERRTREIKRSFQRLIAPVTAAFSVGAITRYTQQAIASLDQIAKKAQTAGISGEMLQELRFAFGELAGVVDTEVDASMRRFQRRLGLAADGGGPAVKTFQTLGITLRDASGRIRDTEVVLNETMTALAAIESDATRAAKASEVFGDDAGPALAAALGKGIDAINETRKATVGLISEERLRDAEALNDMFGRIAGTIGNKLRAEVVGATADLADFWLQAFGGKGVRSEIDRLTRELEKAEDRVRRLEGAPSFMRFGQLDNAIADRDRILAQIEALGQRGGARSGHRSFYDTLINGAADAGAESGAAFLQGLEAIVVTARPKWESDWTPFPQFVDTASQERIKRLTAEAGRVFDQTRTPLERFNAEVSILNQLRDEHVNGKPLISEETYLRAIEQAQDELERLTNKQDSTMRSFGVSLGRSMEDAFADAFLGIETSFGDMLKRLAVRAATSQIFTALGGLGGPVGAAFSFLGFGGARASGGPTDAGKAYLVGERGPELHVPRAAGNVIPNHKLGGMTINVDARGATDPASVEAAVMRGVAAAVEISSSQTESRIAALRRPAMA